MKKLYAFLIFVCGITYTNAQIVTIPDANFKAKLLAASPANSIARNASNVNIKIDTNSDGQIQLSEAQQVYRLEVGSANIASLVGVEAFTNLNYLTCYFNQLTSLNVSSLTNLSILDCKYNQLTSLTISGLTNLKIVDCDHNQLTNLNMSGLTSLTSIECDYNSLTGLTVSDLPQLYYLNCAHNLITTLNLSNLPRVDTVWCSNNLLTNLNMTGLTVLINLHCEYNQLTAIDIAGVNKNLQYLDCSYNNLSAIDVSMRPNYVLAIRCSYNPNLAYINTRDTVAMIIPPPPVLIPGIPPQPPGLRPDIYFEGTPNLQYICADGGDELLYYQDKMSTPGYTNPNCQLSATCDFNTSNTTTASACGSYTWEVNGQTYAASGTYNYVNGSHTEILNLTITPNTTNTTTATVCGSYTWGLNNQTYTTSGTYNVADGCHTEILNLTINNSLITTAPVAPVLCPAMGSTTSVSVATSITTPTYTWQYRQATTDSSPNPAWITLTSTTAGTVYSNYTTAALGIKRMTTLAPKAGTQYRVIVSGGECGSVISDAVSLTIVADTKAGTITAANSVCEANDITFTLNNYAGTSIQWQSAANATSIFTNIPGATNATYTATNMQSGSDKSYRVLVTNAPCGNNAATAIKTITVSPTSAAGTATGGGLICSGGSGTLKVMGYVGKIQWEYSTDGNNYFNAPGASAIPSGLSFGTTSTNSTAATYMVSAITGNLYFRARITSGACAPVYTNVLQYTIADAATVGIASAANATICSGTATTVSLSSATGTVTWQKSTNYATASPTWSTIANSNTLSIATGNLTYNTAFRAMVSIGSCSTVYSNITYVYMVAKPVVKNISKSVTSPSGATATTAMCTNADTKVLTIGIGYAGAIQWQTSTTSTTSGFSDIEGANEVSYTVTNPVAGANYFRAKFTNSCGVSVFGAAVTVYYQDCFSAKFEAAPSFEVVAYPNPYKNGFNLDLHSSIKEIINVSVYDMTGKLIERTVIQPDTVSGLTLGQGCASGLYQVVISQGDMVKTLRVIKE